MYKIDWSQYLKATRSRASKSIVGTKEQGNHQDGRTPFDSDFDRVIFSPAARRMHDKTQVYPLTSGDCVHTRLTHSLEVMNIAQSMSWAYCRNIKFINTYGNDAFHLERDITAIVKTAAFVHDIGNPPFGHYGESTIQNYFTNGKGKKYLKSMTKAQRYDFTQFDGNAQGFRILTKMQYLGDLYGLNLTHATLGTYIKYPNIGGKENGYIGKKKHGVFKSEEDRFDDVVKACNLKSRRYVKRHPLAFLVEAADSICYIAMDLEDGLLLNIISLYQVVEYMDNKLGGRGKLKSLLNYDWNEQSEPKQIEIVDFRVKLIRYLVDKAMNVFTEELPSIDKGTFREELLNVDPNNLFKLLSKFEREKIFSSRKIVQAELTGESVLIGLLDKTLELLSRDETRIKSIISKSGMKLVLHEAGLYQPGMDELKLEQLDMFHKVHLAVDWIAGMTDKYALEMYQKLSGIKL